MSSAGSAPRTQPRPDWAALPRPGCRGVEFRVLLQRAGLMLAQLRFGEGATIDEHDAGWEIDVVCVGGAGFTSIGSQTFEIRAGQTVRWPARTNHRLWTEGSTLETLMVEHLPVSER